MSHMESNEFLIFLILLNNALDYLGNQLKKNLQNDSRHFRSQPSYSVHISPSTNAFMNGEKTSRLLSKESIALN